MNKDVAVIIPAFHAAASLPAALASLDGQAHIAEICVACHDADTRNVANTYTPRDTTITYTVIDNPSGTTPDALNAALDATNAPYVARLDAHATFTPNYLAIARQVHDSATIANVGGIQKPVATTRFQRAVAAALVSVAGSGGATYRTGRSAKDTDTVYLGVFRRDALQQVGGFNPHCLRNQDAELNIRLRAAGHQVWFDPRLAVQYTPRGTWSSLARQYFDYGFWKWVVARRHPGSLKLRQVIPAVVTALVMLGLLGAFTGPLRRIAGLAPAGYLATVLTATATATTGSGTIWLGARVRLLGVFPIMHLAWGLGFWKSALTEIIGRVTKTACDVSGREMRSDR